MIELHGNEEQLVPDPWKVDDKWEGYLGIMGELLIESKRFFRWNKREPSLIRLNPGVIYQTTAKMWAYALVFSGGTAGDRIGLKVGASTPFDWFVPTSPGPFTIPCPVLFDAGSDISVVDITTPAATNYTAYAMAYVEPADDR